MGMWKVNVIKCVHIQKYPMNFIIVHRELSLLTLQNDNTILLFVTAVIVISLTCLDAIGTMLKRLNVLMNCCLTGNV